MNAYVVQKGKLRLKGSVAGVDATLTVPVDCVAKATVVLQAIDLPGNVEIRLKVALKFGVINNWSLEGKKGLCWFKSTRTVDDLIGRLGDTLMRWFPKSRVQRDGEWAIVDGTYRFECEALQSAFMAAEISKVASVIEVILFYDEFYVKVRRLQGTPAIVLIVPVRGGFIELTPEEVNDCFWLEPGR